MSFAIIPDFQSIKYEHIHNKIIEGVWVNFYEGRGGLKIKVYASSIGNKFI